MGKKIYSLTILYFLAAACISSHVTSAQAGRETYPAQCTKLEDCDNLWRHGEAFACLEGSCSCHPQATFDATNKNCKCNQGYTKNGNQCHAKCTKLEDCDNLWRHGEAFACLEGRCSCHPQATFDAPNKNCKCNQGYTKNGNQCLEVPQPPPPLPTNGSAAANPASRSLPGTCVSEKDCGENSQCLPTGCECKTGYKLISNVCKTVARSVGDLCEFDEQCQFELGGHSKCENTKCVCMTHSVPVLNDTECVAKKELTERCTYHEQCSHVQHGTCSVDVCLCDPGFVVYEGSCLAVVDTYNAICTETIQCSNGKLGYGSVCKSTEANVDLKSCVCELEYFYRREKQICLYAKGLEEECDDVNNGCYLFKDGEDQNIECRNKKCSCKARFLPSEDNTQCERGGGVVIHVNYMVLALSLLMYLIRWGKMHD